jgi:hypothetical protein
MEVKGFRICCGYKRINANFLYIEEQERLHSTIPKTSAKQTRSNKKVCLVTFVRSNTQKFKFIRLNSRRNL